LISDIPAGDEKIRNQFLQCSLFLNIKTSKYAVCKGIIEPVTYTCRKAGAS